MRFRALGPVQVWDGSGWVGVRAPQQRVVLAVLLAEAGRVVSTARLVREIWASSPPRSAVNTIQTYVLRLRRLFEDESMLVSRGSGYQLVVGEDDVDIHLFERLVSGGRDALAHDRPAVGVQLISRALGLWRGAAMAGVPESPTVIAEANRLELHRVGAYEDQVEARLGLGGHVEVVDELVRLVDEHPFRERLRGQLVLALYRSGRRADAIRWCREGRRLMREELGLDPAPVLLRLESAIRDDDPSLRLPDQPAAPAGACLATAGANAAPGASTAPGANAVPPARPGYTVPPLLTPAAAARFRPAAAAASTNSAPPPPKNNAAAPATSAGRSRAVGGCSRVG